MKIRRYYGYDCDSVMGFNNGYYIDDEPIEVKDLDEAFKSCRDALSERWDLEQFKEHDFNELDNGIELITGYFSEGDELAYKEFIQVDDPNGTKTHWRYVYVTFEVIEE